MVSLFSGTTIYWNHRQFYQNMHALIHDVVWPKMSPSVSFSGSQRKQFLLCRKRTNSWCRAHMYFSTHFFPFVRFIEDRYQWYKIIFNTNLFSNVVIMTLNYFLCPISAQNPDKCTFWRYMYISPASTHRDKQQHHSTTLPLYHLHTANI